MQLFSPWPGAVVHGRVLGVVVHARQAAADEQCRVWRTCADLVYTSTPNQTHEPVIRRHQPWAVLYSYKIFVEQDAAREICVV